MTIWWLAAILLALGSAGVAFIWLAVRIGRVYGAKNKPDNEILEHANKDVERVFNDEFREELRNRGRLHFEKILGENAMFLQQDLRLTTSQLNDYMKDELTKTLHEEFAKYEQSIMDAKKLAIDSIEKTSRTIEDERRQLSEQLKIEIAAEKERLVTRFEENMADIVNHYVVAAIGQQIDLSDQLEFITQELETNKKAISEDIKNGA